MKKLKSESGRSMVEMLGVLAIIGVLSVGGIAGYSLSMRRHRANGVVDALSKFAVTAYGLCQQKVLNGELSELNGCDIGDTNFKFSDAGIGELPSGVTGLGSWVVRSYETGVDLVDINLDFSDQKLCQAVASVVGKTCSNGNYITGIEIKQN